MISSEVKKSINLYVPLLLAALVGFTAWKRKSSWQALLIMTGATWLIVWLISKQTVKLIGAAVDRPKPIDVNPDVGGYLPANFEPQRWAKMLRDDMYNVFSLRNHELYKTVSSMNDSQLVAINNVWNKLYFVEHQESLLEAMNAEMYGNNLLDNTANNANNIKQRLGRLMNT